MVPPHGLNRGPIDYKSIALPTELQGHRRIYKLKTTFCNKNKLLQLIMIKDVLNL